jgi:voltage-gated potassium channel Kch
MLAFFLTIRRLIRAFVFAWRDTEFRNLFLLLLALIVSGTMFYASVEGWSLIDSLYFSVVTLATVGYGDLAPQTTAGKLFTIIYIFIGIGLFVAVAQNLASGLGEARKASKERRRRRKESKASARSDLPENHPNDDS